MNDADLTRLSADDWDELINPRPVENDFDRVVEAAISRRGFLGGVLAFGSGAAAMGTGTMIPATSAQAQATSRFAFTPIDIQTDATVHVPRGYRWDVLIRWGDPIFPDAPGFNHETGGDAESADRIFGENTDGMESFQVGGRQLLAINHEYTNREINLPHATDGVPTGLDDVRKLQRLQGVAVIEVAEDAEGWHVVKDSPMNRRITHLTPMKIAGPAAAHDLLKTDADPTGTKSLGTFNNCGSGKTPWGTYLTCEENFNGYFGATGAVEVSDPVDAGYERYGIGADGWGYDYHKWDDRFDISKHPHEPHRAGWVVEIDPADPDSTPVKHTGLGRFKHENAEVVLASDGRVVVYMGDDERGEFLYRFVSNGAYTPGGPTEGLLDDGTLYAAKFHDDQSGEWLALTPETTGMASLAEVLVFARQAGSAVGATTMDRPEWIAANPHAVEAYCCLTNNKNRGVKPNAGGDETAVNGPNPRETNNYGQIVRWRPENDDYANDRFTWDLYVMAGNPEIYDNIYGGSENITAGNMFNSPDGMAFDSAGLVWIQTDGDNSNQGEFEGMGNNQMLVGDPVTGEIARFLTGPKGSEVTGLTWSIDRRTMFVGIQHPDAPFPDGEGKLPRSAIVAVKRDDGAPLG
ncbi:PhoX family protein [Roseovarius atlanticus]|uniref:PhoX family protein n=1 Tax=Roseovarius atlanticus TaxID=1641875 RepID=UPI001C93AD58|nr:PhoX family phosphatase [Roseovarius atlanticus]MBY5988916.1 PhoX family phosphatase [Roseovarius atlanticus]MBY6124307.1 PhoX family phosphatase [Roseovarius atlanticus]MBY6148802.1 PhoX family phosphatase [Roseovarius atlanticus]